MHSKRPKFSKFLQGSMPPDTPRISRRQRSQLAPLPQVVYSLPAPKLLPPTQSPIENPAMYYHFVSRYNL